MKHKTIRSLLFSVATLLLVIGFQNCGTEFQPHLDQSIQNSPSVITSPCQNNQKAQTCLFDKNPPISRVIASSGLTQTGNINSELNMEISNSKIFEVTELKNKFVSVQHINGNRLKTKDGHFRYTIEESEHNPVGQLMAFYYATDFILTHPELSQYFERNPINLIVDAPFSGWSPKKQSVYLGLKDNQSMAYDGSLIVYYVAYAYLQSISNPDNVSLQHTHETCENNSNELCCPPGGCYQAWLYGLSETMVSHYFEDSPSVGSYWSQSDDGSSHCGVHRNPKINAQLSYEEALQTCVDGDGERNPIIIGSFLASLLWEISENQNGEVFYEFLFLLADGLEISDSMNSLMNKPRISTSPLSQDFILNLRERQ